MIRFVLRWLVRLLALAIVLVVALVAFKDLLLREFIVHRLRAVSGLETRLQAASADLRRGTLTLTNLQFDNAPAFGGGPFLAVPELQLELDTAGLAQRKFGLTRARLHVTEFNVVRNERGETNVLALLPVLRERATAADAVLVAPPGFEFSGIGTLQLTLGTLRLVQLGPVTVSREFPLGVTNQVLHNVRSPEDLTPVLLRMLAGLFAPRDAR